MTVERAIDEFALLQKGLDRAPLMIGFVGSDLRYRYVNEYYARVFARPREEIVGRPVREVIGEEAFTSLQAEIERAMCGQQVQYQRWLDLPAAGRRYLSSTYLPYSSNGKVEGVFVYATDTTEARIAEEAQRESEQRFRAVFDNASVGIGVVSLDGKIISVNQYVCEMLGYDEAELTGRSSTDLLHPHEAVTSKLPRELSEGIVPNVEEVRRFVPKGGDQVWAAVSYSLLRDAAGEPTCIIAVIQDVTARKQVEQALAASERMYRSTFENAAVGMARIGPNGEWLDVNDRLCAKLGYTREELTRLTFQDITYPEDLAEDVRQADLLLGGAIDFYELDKRYVRKDGTVLWAHLTASMVRDENGRLLYAIAVVEDITARKEAEAVLLDMNQALESRVEERTAELIELNRELDSFNYSVSHDLRAPLRGIYGFSQALLDDYGDGLDERGKHYLERVKGAAGRMGDLIDALLMLSRLTRGEIELRQVDLSALAHQIAAALREEEPGRDVDIHIVPEAFVHADEKLLRVLLHNLLENAWKFTRYAKRASISVGFETSDGEDICFVEDNGAGFDEEYSHKLFVPFQRLHNPSEFEGLGIGLATAQRIVNKHGGRIWATGAVGKRATFYFAIPNEK